jgi:hypothetical protein
VQVLIYVDEEDAGGPRPKLSYVRGSEVLLKTASVRRLIEYAAWDVHACIPGKTRDYLLLHAGAVARAGDAILIAGPAEVGKSSLVAGLLRRGFDYLSDELGAIDPVTERAYGFPKWISLSPAAVDAFPGLRERLDDRPGIPESANVRVVRPEDLDATVATPSHVRSIVFPSFDREGSPRLTTLARSEAVRRMAELSFNLYRYEERGVVLLSRIADDAAAFSLEGGTIMERADLIAERLGVPG